MCNAARITPADQDGDHTASHKPDREERYDYLNRGP
jgi:hypothetical protein